MHHKHLSRDGVYVQPALTKAAVAGLKQDTTFHASLTDPNDEVYAQPLFVDGGSSGPDLVVIATEANNVYAFNAATGTQAWMQNVGASVPIATLNTCGNLDRYGITGTPVIDFASRTLFFDALVLPAGAGAKPQHEIFALSIDTGAVKPGWPVDVALNAKSGSVTSFNDIYQGQRGALAIVNGTLYVPFGGLFGDCQPLDASPRYHGWVVAVSIADPTQVSAWATPADAGGLWGPGGISSDGSGIYVASGNTDPDNSGSMPWGGGDAVLRFGTGAAFGSPTGYFAPGNWHLLDEGDDEPVSGPVLFSLAGSTPAQLAIVFGKDGNAYLLDPANLGGVGGALGAPGSPATYPYATAHVSVVEIITAPSVYATATATYAVLRGNAGSMCANGTGSGDLMALKIAPGSPPTITNAWCAVAGAGSTMVTTSDGTADAIVWVPGAEGNNHLNAFDGDTGKAISFAGSTLTIPGMRRFNPPIAAKGRIFVATDTAIIAFSL